MRYQLILWEMMQALRDAPEPMPRSQVVDAVSARIRPTAAETTRTSTGRVRWEIALNFQSGDAVTVGWMTKRGGWAIVEAGLEALEAFPAPGGLYAELKRRYREVDQRRARALHNLSDVEHFITRVLQAVGAGTWTAHDDLAELAGTTPTEVAHFLASAQVRLPNAYRVLDADGSIPSEGMLNAYYRGTDLSARLAAEGIEFDGSGHASQEQRLTADVLKDLLTADQADDEPTSVRRAWMVRGSNVDGYNLVPDWLRDGFVSLSASQLGGLDPSAGFDKLKEAVETAYQHKSYAYRGQRLEELDRFLRRMRAGDLVLTTLRGEVYIGAVTGPARFADAAPHSNLRRDVNWLNAAYPIAGSKLPAPVPALLQSQAYVVDLTEAYGLVMDLLRAVPTQAPTPVPNPEPAKRSLAFHPVTEAMAENLLIAGAELSKIADLL